jgi:hypothetical protein
MEWFGFIAWLGAIGAGLWILHSVMRRLDWSNRIHRVTSAGLLLLLVAISIRLTILPVEHLSEASFLLLMVTPPFIIGVASSLIHSGLSVMRGYGWPALLIGGLLLLCCIAVTSNLAMGVCTADGGLFFLYLVTDLIYVAIIAIMFALWFAVTLPGKRKTAALLLIVVFPGCLYIGLLLRFFLTPQCMTLAMG